MYPSRALFSLAVSASIRILWYFGVLPTNKNSSWIYQEALRYKTRQSRWKTRWTAISCFCMDFYRKSLKMWYNEVLEKQVSFAWKILCLKRILYYSFWFTIHLVNFISVLPTQCLWCSSNVTNVSWATMFSFDRFMSISKDSKQKLRKLVSVQAYVDGHGSWGQGTWKLLDILR